MTNGAGNSATRLPIRRQRPILHYSEGEVSRMDDVVATEYALTIYVNDQEMATVVCTPEYMEDLVIGFLASEGVVRSMDQLVDIQISQFRGIARVRTTSSVNFNQAFYNKRYIASCCGKGRQSFYFYNDAHTARKVDDPVRIRPDQVFTLVHAMEAAGDLWRETGGVHMASLCTPDQLLLSRVDIGRHNALDKLYGHVFRSGDSVAGKVIAFSGRLSSEVVLKCAKIGVGIVLAKSAPTTLALDIADELGITAIGFVRENSFNVYSHPWRVEAATQFGSCP
jgi:FdhD protein